jgi:multidrug efflux system outer membrane protein
MPYRPYKYLAVAMMFMALSACQAFKVKPYQFPGEERKISPSTQLSNTGSSVENFADTDWWNLFNDPKLVLLIEDVLNQNLSLETTVNAIRQSQLLMDISDTQNHPFVNYGVSPSLGKNTAVSRVSRNLIGAVNVSYTFDAWDKIKYQNEAAFEAYLATEAAHFQLKAVLISQIATLYFELRDIDNKIIVAEKMTDTMSEFRDIIQARYDGGIVSKVDLNQIEIVLKDVKLVEAALLRGRGQIENAINLLTATPSRTIARGLPLQNQIFPSSLPAGVPSSLLERRPSIIVIEKQMAAQKAVAASTNALQYPNFTISFDVGAQASSPAMLFSALTGNMLGPIFDSGLIDTKIELEEEKYRLLAIQYEQEYLLALSEVADSLIAISTYEKENALRLEQLQLSEEALNLAWIRYNEGATSLLEFLNLQTSLFNAQINASDSYKLKLQSIVKLYLALGGGWERS